MTASADETPGGRLRSVTGAISVGADVGPFPPDLLVLYADLRVFDASAVFNGVERRGRLG
jgi:hypothetical protein